MDMLAREWMDLREYMEEMGLVLGIPRERCCWSLQIWFDRL